MLVSIIQQCITCLYFHISVYDTFSLLSIPSSLVSLHFLFLVFPILPLFLFGLTFTPVMVSSAIFSIIIWLLLNFPFSIFSWLTILKENRKKNFFNSLKKMYLFLPNCFLLSIHVNWQGYLKILNWVASLIIYEIPLKRSCKNKSF